MSLFQNNSLEVDNPQSREEDEELEEQRRRQEELADLLAAGIAEFNYDESTMNSSVTSVETVPRLVHNKHDLKYDESSKVSMENTVNHLPNNLEQNFKNADQEEQLRILYDVRVREINKLREEFNKFKEEAMTETKILKNKATLAEAETRHLQVTLSNSESLLVEKNQIIHNLTKNVDSKDKEIQTLKKTLEEQNLEICTYQSTVNELELKLADNNPFSSGARKLNSGELQKVHQEQVVKLETFLQEQTKKCQFLEKEKKSLEDDLKKLLQHKKEIEEENNLTIVGLSKKLQSAQQQCKDLFMLGEAIKKESDHFKERLQQLESNNWDGSEDEFLARSLDKETMVVHLEKLKRMLLDKDVELNTLKAKLKFYDSDIQELFEYRRLFNTMSSCEVKPCSNSEHAEVIIFLQRQLQTYQQAVEDRNNQIMNLNLVNKELQEQIEETIQKTRTDIQNISQKYSLPQLETMSKELQNAEDTINSLKQELSEKNDVVEKLQRITHEKDSLQEIMIRDKLNFEQTLKECNNEKNKLLKELSEFKKVELQLVEENERVKRQLQKICLKLGLSEADIFESESDVHEVKSLKSKYGQIHDQLQQVLAHLENMNFKRTNFNIIFALKKQMQDYFTLLNEQKLEQQFFQEKLEQWDNMLSDFIESLRHSSGGDAGDTELTDKIEEVTNAKTMLEGEKFALEYQLTSRGNELEEAKKEIELLKETNSTIKQECEQNSRAVLKLNDQIQNLKKCLHIVEENKAEVEKQLENTQKQLNEAKQELIDLHKEVNEVSEEAVKRNLVKQLKDVENDLEKTTENVTENDIYQKCLKAELLKMEISLRDRFQEENIKKMQNIENQYKTVITEKSEMYKKMKEKWKLQEANYRKQFAEILEECGKKMEELELENAHLRQQVHGLFEEYKTFRKNVVEVEKYNQLVIGCKKAIQDLNNKWIKILENYMIGCAKIEKQRRISGKSIAQKMNTGQCEVNFLERKFDEKIRKFKAENGKK